MRLQLRDGLPFTRVVISYLGKEIEIDNVLVDTGSASTLFAADQVAQISITPEPNDTLYAIRGVGGSETVFSRVVEEIRIAQHGVKQFEIEIGGMDYGFEINGIVGMDFLTGVGAIINLKDLRIDFG